MTRMGSMEWPGSVASLQTQLGEGGQSRSGPAMSPALREGAPLQLARLMRLNRPKLQRKYPQVIDHETAGRRRNGKADMGRFPTNTHGFCSRWVSSRIRNQ